MPDSSEAQYQASLETARNPNGEPYSVFTSDKSWDEASDKIVAHRQVPLIQIVQKTVEVPRGPTIEARDSQDYPRDPRRDSARERADEVLDATPFAKADRTKKRRKAEGQDQDVDVEGSTT